jgi:hypothetical protein
MESALEVLLKLNHGNIGLSVTNITGPHFTREAGRQGRHVEVVPASRRQAPRTSIHIK